VTVNTDDPAMFGCTLAGEFDALARTFAISEAEVRRVILNAVAAAWMPEERKRELANRIAADPAWPNR
jgi:aminodeoxyfutalosine deaminase